MSAVEQRIKDIIRENATGDYGPEAFIDGVDTEAVAARVTREFAVLHRSEETIEERGGYFICGSGPEECGARPSDNPNWLRNHAANAIALAEYLEGQEAKDNARNKRRDELAREFADDGAYAYRFASPDVQRAIDRIVEIEAAL